MVHKTKRLDDFKEAVEGEGWAINDYKDMIAKAKSRHEKKVLTHIMNEEQEHLGELFKLMSCEVK